MPTMIPAMKNQPRYSIDQMISFVAIPSNREGDRMKFVFRSGNFVRLKAGGPIMTVEAVYATGSAEMVQCQWFREGKFHQGIFEAMDLVHMEEQAGRGTGGTT